MFDVRETTLPDCLEIQPFIRDDDRGRFVKVFHEDEFKKLGLETNFPEEYYSKSKQDVIRGMHFQTPPFDHVKVVFCTNGSVLDVAVDIRKGSPAFGRFTCIELSAERGNAIYLPKGFAHGFFVLSNEATLVYKVSTEHAQAHDHGIRWDSVNIPWPTTTPVMSDRDRLLPALANFDSPFVYGASTN